MKPAGDPSDGTLLKKWLGILAAASGNGLSAGEVSTLLWIAEYANAQTCVAWPSYETLAAVTGQTRRNAVRSVATLIRTGFLQVVTPGTRTSSNRYCLTFKGADGVLMRKRLASRQESGGDRAVTSASQGNAASGDGTVPTVVTPMVGCGDIPGIDVVTPASLDTNHDPAHQGRGVVGGSISSSAAAGSAPAVAGSPSAASELVHSWFWKHYPKRRGAMAADAALTKAFAFGADRNAIEAGVIAYAAWVAAQPWSNDKYIATPIQWIDKARWHDDWTVKIPKPAPQKADGKRQTGAKPRNGAKATRSASGKGSGSAEPKKAAAKPARRQAPSAQGVAQRARSEGLTIQKLVRPVRLPEESEAERLTKKRADAEAAELRRLAAEKARAEQEAAIAHAASEAARLEAEKLAEREKAAALLRVRLLALGPTVVAKNESLRFAGSAVLRLAKHAGRKIKGIDSFSKLDLEMLGRALRNGPDDQEDRSTLFRRLDFDDLQAVVVGCEACQ